DGAAVARVRLDDLARPLWIEEVGEALRCLLLLHQPGVVTDHRQPDAPAGEEAAGLLVLGRVVRRYVLREIGRQDAVALPDDEMSRIRAVDHVHCVDAAAVLLADALEDPLAAGALHPHGDARILRLERLRDALGDGKIDRGVPDDLAFLPRRFDELWRDPGGRGRGRSGPRRPAQERDGERGGGQALEDAAPADL